MRVGFSGTETSTLPGYYQGGITKESITNGSITKGSITKGVLLKGVLPRVSITKAGITIGILPMGSITKGVLARGSITKGVLPKVGITKREYYQGGVHKLQRCPIGKGAFSRIKFITHHIQRWMEAIFWVGGI